MIREEVSARLLQTDVTRSYIKMWNPISAILTLLTSNSLKILELNLNGREQRLSNLDSLYNSVAFFDSKIHMYLES